MKVFVNGVEMALRVDLSNITPLDSDLTQIPSAYAVVEDPAKTLTSVQVPRLYHAVQIYKDDGVTLHFGGYVNTLNEMDMQPVGRAWGLLCVGYGTRLVETATGSLNKSGVTDSDRNFVIQILEDALDNQTFAGTIVDDAIIAANAGWLGVKQTTFMSGVDWSYTSPRSAINSLLRFAPNAYFSIGADRVVSYGLRRELAPFALSTSPNGTSTKGFSEYREEEVIGDHKNKMRRGGAGASEVTAVDETSWAKYGRILDAGYVNDTAIPAADLTRRAYAELRTKRTRRRVTLSVRDEGLVAGQVVDIVNARVGPGTRPGVMAIMEVAMSRSASGALAGERGRMLITKVTTTPLGNLNYRWDIEVGDVFTEFPLELPAATEAT